MNTRSRGIALAYAYTLLNMVCGLFLSSFLLRMLGDEEFGLYQTVSAFASYMVLLEFGIGTVMSRNLAVCRSSQGDGEEQQAKINRYVSTLWYVALILSAVILVVGAVFCANIGHIYRKTIQTPEEVRYAQVIFAVLTGHLILSFLDQTLSGVLLGMEQYTFHRTAGIIRILLRTALLVGLICFRPLALVIALVDLFVYLAMFLSSFLFCKIRYRLTFRPSGFDKRVFLESLPLCLALLIQAAVNQANNNVDKFIIGITMSLSSVALYAVSQYIYTMFSSLTTLPIALFMPQVARDMERGASGRVLVDALIPVCRMVTLLGGTVLGGFIAVGKPFLALVYGAGKTDAWLYALILLVPQFIDTTAAILLNVLDITRRRLFRSLVLLGATVLNVGLTLWFIPRAGITGAVSATAISTLCQMVVMAVYYKKRMGLPILYLYREAYRGLLPIQLPVAMAVCLGMLALEQVITHPLPLFLIGGCLYLLMTGGLILRFGLRPEEKDRLRATIWRKQHRQ